MLASVPTEILTGGFAIIGTLTAYVWNAQSKSISELKKKNKRQAVFDRLLSY